MRYGKTEVTSAPILLARGGGTCADGVSCPECQLVNQLAISKAVLNSFLDSQNLEWFLKHNFFLKLVGTLSPLTVPPLLTHTH